MTKVFIKNLIRKAFKKMFDSLLFNLDFQIHNSRKNEQSVFMRESWIINLTEEWNSITHRDSH